MEAQRDKKRVRDDSDEFGSDSVEVKKLRENLLEFLDDSDPDPSSHDLDSVMKSLQEEISAPCSPVPLIDLTLESAESQPDIGYLLEASDYELGLPPGNSSNEEVKNRRDRVNPSLF
ncbi:Carbohydrate-responsive element-binding protein [Quillaja saponaria]|uniref:Carbohydrate-responsive element-binding protein n=1 Tax=Quillaja saponaria TaxID=32244 RepID=A0AAD7PGJ7_QUISA|nr:Carbohydrate-responsive element-binding protein [Quillaja saponaria]